MNRRSIFQVVMALILVGAVLGLGAWAYSLGVAHGATSNADVNAPIAPYGMPIWPFYGFPFFGFLACLVPIFLVFTLTFAFRGLFWHGGRHWGHYYPGPGSKEWTGDREGWRRGARSVFDAWHAEAHAPKTEEQKPPS